MIVDVLLALLSFAAVIVAVLSKTDLPELRTRGWRAVNVWGYAALVVSFLVVGVSIAKSWRDAAKSSRDAQDRQNLLTQLSELSEYASRIPIRPAEFEIRVLANYRKEPEATLPEALEINGALEKATYLGELINTKVQSRIRAGGRGGGSIGYRYRATNLSFQQGPAQYSHFKDLNGKPFTVEFDPNKFPAPSDLNDYRDFLADLYMPGHLCKLSRTRDGRYQVIVGNQDCF